MRPERETPEASPKETAARSASEFGRWRTVGRMPDRVRRALFAVPKRGRGDDREVAR